MSKAQEYLNPQPQAAPQAAPALVPAQIVESASGIEGKVNEIAQSKVSQQMQGQNSDDSGTGQATNGTALAQDREALKQRLLKNAPKESQMRKDVQVALESRKNKLETHVRKYRRRGNYHHLSLAIMQLREVIRQIEEIAQMGYEALESLWLKIIHRFA